MNIVREPVLSQSHNAEIINSYILEKILIGTTGSCNEDQMMTPFWNSDIIGLKQLIRYIQKAYKVLS